MANRPAQHLHPRLDEWLTLIATGHAVGITYRRVRDAPPVPISLAWWQDNRPAQAAALTHQIRRTYAANAPTSPHLAGADRAATAPR